MSMDHLRERQEIVNRMLDICIALNVEVWNEDQTEAELLHLEWESLNQQLKQMDDVSIPFVIRLSRLSDGKSFSITMDLDWVNAYEDAVQTFGESHRILSVYPLEHLPYRAEWVDLDIKRNLIRSYY